jgi:hypothetical protein
LDCEPCAGNMNIFMTGFSRQKIKMTMEIERPNVLARTSS